MEPQAATARDQRAPVPADPGADAAARRSRRQTLLRRSAMLCLVLVLAITSLSAFLRLSRAGLSCADWPRCYGQNLREQQRGLVSAAGESDATAAARLSHRVVASAALLLVSLMVIACFAGGVPITEPSSVAPNSEFGIRSAE